MRRFKIHTAPNLYLFIYDKSNQDDRSTIQKYCTEIFRILHDGYKHINGCTVYKSPNHMYKNVARYKLVVDQDFNIYACAVYRHMPATNSYKCILISENKNIPQDHKAVRTIIKSDIVNFQKLYWIEASGPIAHWEEKYGAIKIPNVYVPVIFSKATNITLNPDGYSYSRNFDMYDTPVNKTIFGFPSKEILDKMLSYPAIQKYTELLINVIGKDEAECLYEAFGMQGRSRWCILYKTMLYIEDAHTNECKFSNLTGSVRTLIIRLIKEAQSLIPEVHPKYKEDFINLIDEMKMIIEWAGDLTPHRLF